MTDIFTLLESEYFRDPIVHAHLTSYRYGNVSERDALIAIVKDLSKNNEIWLQKMIEIARNSPTKPTLIPKDYI